MLENSKVTEKMRIVSIKRPGDKGTIKMVALFGEHPENFIAVRYYQDPDTYKYVKTIEVCAEYFAKEYKVCSLCKPELDKINREYG